MANIYKLKPILQATVWGSNKITEYYNIQTDIEKVGQMYHVIALENHLDNIIEDTGETLSSFYREHRDLFDCKSDVFPVRMATACNAGKMSYHLHPDNEYARVHENSLGKVSGSIPYEAKGAVRRSLYGNKAKSLNEFKRMVCEKDWDHLFSCVEIRDDQYFHTPAGVIHGGAGDETMSIVFATNSDLSYRFYDYDRNDPNRKLSLEKVYDCVNIPEVPFGPIDARPYRCGDLNITDYYDKKNEYTAKKVECQNKGLLEVDRFVFLLAAKGSGRIGGVDVRAGTTVFVPAHYGRLAIEGEMKLYMVSYQD